MQLLRVRPITISWLLFVVMSKEEGSMYRKRLHIPMILGRIDTSQTVLKRSDTGKTRKMKLYTALLACYSSDDVLSTHPFRSS